jgi:hypothetical protein
MSRPPTKAKQRPSSLIRSKVQEYIMLKQLIKLISVPPPPASRFLLHRVVAATSCDRLNLFVIPQNYPCSYSWKSSSIPEPLGGFVSCSPGKAQRIKTASLITHNFFFDSNLGQAASTRKAH